MLPDTLRADLARYIEVLEARFGSDLISVVVFGSQARGEAKPESDIDVLIVIRGLPRNRFERYSGFRDLARETRTRSPRTSRRFCLHRRRRSGSSLTTLGCCRGT